MWNILTESAVSQAKVIVADNSHRGLPTTGADAYAWVNELKKIVAAGPDAPLAQTPPDCPRIMLCIPTFKRTWQIRQTLPINIVLAWKFRHLVHFIVADLNHPVDRDIERLMCRCEAGTSIGLVRHFRRSVPETDGFTHWHASKGKNTAHAMGASCCENDRNPILVNLDNDNFVSDKFFWDIISRMDKLVSRQISGMRWKHPGAPPCTGRAAAIGGVSPSPRGHHAGTLSRRSVNVRTGLAGRRAPFGLFYTQSRSAEVLHGFVFPVCFQF